MQKTTFFTKCLSCILCVMLIAAAVMMLPGCKEVQPEAPTDTATAAVTEVGTGETATTAVTEVGTGETRFIFLVTDKDNNRTDFAVSTDKKTVGEALLDAGLVEGDMGAYGLYVKKVIGISADYETDGVYWAFYVNGEMSMTGVDQTNITPDAIYEFRVAK